MSEFEEIQAAVESQEQIVKIDVRYADVFKDNTISFNDKVFSYTHE